MDLVIIDEIEKKVLILEQTNARINELELINKKILESIENYDQTTSLPVLFIPELKKILGIDELKNLAENE